VKLGLACEGGPPPAPVLDLLERTGLPAGVLRSVAGPALVDAGEVTWLLAPAADVIEACARGALDAGVAGKDLLLELVPQVHELLDLRVCRDVLVYATPEPAVAAVRRGRPRVATRYPRVTRRHFAASGRQVELVAFDVARLAPGLGIADGVVELRSGLVDDGGGAGSARVAGLRVREEIAVCSARLVAGRAARALSGERLTELLERLRASVEEL
jgi:ATP phosphoribosyltransferase